MQETNLRPNGGALAALRRVLWRLDPGLIQTSKAALVLAALACTLAGSHLLVDLWPGLARLDLSLFMGAGAIPLVLIMNPEPRARQRRMLLVGALSFQGLLLGLGLLSLAAGPEAIPVAKLAFLPLAATCLYLSHFGPSAGGLGKSAFSFALFAALQEPQWEEIGGLMLATALGSGTFLLLERLLPRPSAFSMLARAKRLYLQELSVRLRALTLSNRGRKPLSDPTWLGRQSLRLLLRTARIEEPQHYALLSRRLQLSYRMELSLRLLTRSLETAQELTEGQWDLAAAALMETAARIASERPGSALPGPALRDLRRRALALPEEQADSRRHLVGAAAALQRLLALRAGLEEEWAPMHYDPLPTAPWTRSGLAPAARLALQGLVGVGLATALDLGFTMSHGYWATITVFFILSGSLGETLLRAQKRMLGTAIGVLAALSYIWVFGTSANLVLAVLTALALGLVVASMLRYWTTAAVALGFMVISGLHLIKDLPMEAMMARIYETAIGAVIGMLVARLILPLHVSRSLERDFASWLKDIRLLLSQMGVRPAEELRRESMALGERASTISDSLPQLRAEAWLGLRALQKPVAVHTALDAVIGYLALLEPSVTRLPFHLGDQPSDREARALLDRVTDCLTALEAGRDSQVHSLLATVEDRLRQGGTDSFEESDLEHLDTRLQQIFYLTALIQVIDDLSLALHPQGDRQGASAVSARRWHEAAIPPPGSPSPSPR